MIAAPVNMKVEHFDGDVLGIGTATPRLSWQYTQALPTDAKIELRICRRKPRHGTGEDHAIISVADNVLLPWQFAPLDSRELVEAMVRVITTDDVGEWSEPIRFDVGLLQPHQRVADFIGPSWPEFQTDHRHQPIVRTEFDLPRKPILARLYLTALGLVEAELNGSKVGNDVLNPGWTSYDNRVECWTYDVLDQLNIGRNAMGFWLADGWYRGRVGFDGGEANVWGDRIGVFAQLEVTYADGTRQSWYSNSSDEQWKITLGPITRSNMYEGEYYDARLEQSGWSMPGFDDSDWKPVSEIPFDEHRIEFPVMEAIQPDGTNTPSSIERIGETDDGRGIWMIDMGQNCSQRLSLHFRGLSAGQNVTIEHVEVLDGNGEPVQRILHRGVQRDRYTSNGCDSWWEPRFTMHGFRYARVAGLPELAADDVRCTVYHTAMERTGWFESSNPMVNALHRNTVWAMKSNFMSIPTDCPQRDERVGWTADIAVFAPTALYLYDATGFLRNWMRDVSFEQRKTGTVPFYIPYVPMGIWSDPAAIALWGDAAVLVPWAAYMSSGDTQILSESYDCSIAWMNEVTGYLSPDGVWDRRPDYAIGQLGDWLDPQAPPEEPDRAMTAKELVATAFYVHSCDLMVRIANTLGRRDDAERFMKLAEHARCGFRARFIVASNDSDARMTSDTQCAYALAIMFGLGDGAVQERAFGNRLAELVRLADGRIGTGFAGTPFVLPALTRTGHMDEAYALFLSTKCPSWMYQITMGATTTWERWDSMLPNGEVNPGGMTSFNHYALGSVNDWVHATVGGIAPMEPGWKRILVAPRPGGDIAHAAASHMSPYGMVGIEWSVASAKDAGRAEMSGCDDDALLSIHLTVPYGTIAVLRLPGSNDVEYPGGEYDISVPWREKNQSV